MRDIWATVRLALISAVARTPAFLVPVVIAAIFGAGASTDAYFLAYSAVLFLGGTLAQGLEQAVVPFAANQLENHQRTARLYLDRTARGATLVGAALWMTGVLGLAGVAQMALRRSVLTYAAAFTPLTLSWSAAAAFSGALISQEKIGTSTGSMLWRGLGALVGLSMAPLGGGLFAVALGLGVGEICRTWWLRSRLYAAVSHGDSSGVTPLRPLAIAAGAQATAGAVVAAAPVVERLLATSLGVGAVSHLEYGMRLLAVPGVLFDGALVPLLLARWSRQVTAEGYHPTRSEVLHAVRDGIALACFLGLLLAGAARGFVHLVLAHGRFTAADEIAVVGLVRLLAVAFVANVTAQMLERHYIATARNRTLAALSIGRTGIRILIAWALLATLGLNAFAVGFAVSECIYLIVLVWLLASPAKAAQIVRAS
jgi:putative peptidoglycan lipid II flippase